MKRYLAAAFILAVVARPALAINLSWKVSVAGPGGKVVHATIETLANKGVSTSDLQSGQMGKGKVTFNPFSLTRKVDVASPSLFGALVGGSSTVTLEGFDGTKLVSKVVLAGVTATKSKAPPSEHEVYSLTFKEITWTWVDGGVTKHAMWMQPLS